MQRLKSTFARFFTLIPLSQFIQWIFLILSVIVACLVAPFSLKKSKINPEKCMLERLIYLTTNSTTIFTNFTKFLSRTERKLDLVLSIPNDVKEYSNFWETSFEGLAERGIAVRVYTNNKNFKSKYATIRYYTGTAEFHMNFAVSDDIDIYFPSSFVDNNLSGNTFISYIVILRQCQSAGTDLSSLFDLLWNKQKSKIVKNSWIANKGYSIYHGKTNLTFHVEPMPEFPVGRPDIKSKLYEMMSLLYTKKMIFSQKVFPDSPVYSHESALISSLFEVIPSYIEESETFLSVDINHFEDHKSDFRSMTSNMVYGGLTVCNVTFQGTIIASGSLEKSKLFLIQSGIASACTGGVVLGLSIEHEIIEEIEDLLFELVDSNVCVKIPHPKIY